LPESPKGCTVLSDLGVGSRIIRAVIQAIKDGNEEEISREEKGTKVGFLRG